ncbi:YegS/Rv2252/BmrU family lipid kinase [Paenibacillus tritici]|uniref:diacylglycerol/lipid kinase family protein n=1 Tax=Paenibacillus tritici TaxID=1873425 RepID=UPI001BA4B737|nr:YegS/Rv2252/BmrU family lipid kinase [Paenibacillus tritici]QUL54803.1 YegS/Rv2252/BmrU family lipid kinase [Paenibacillus tritici]
MQQAMIIMNPSSGKAEARDYIRAVEEVLQGAGYQVAVHETAGEGDATAFCNQACCEGYDLVVAIGGDGTLHETMNGLAGQQHRPKLGIVPMGTVNDFARALQIPLNPEEAIQTLSSPHTQRVDMGRLNDRLFANVVAAGSLAGSLSSVTTEDKTRLGFLAYLKEGIKELASNTAHTLTITHDGEVWEGSSPLFIAALTNSVGGFEKLAPNAAVDDGLLHCFIVKDLHLLNSVTVSISLLLGNLRNHKDVIYFTAKEVSVRSADPVQTNVDGEEGPLLPIRLSTLPRHIQVVVPED